MDPGRSRAAKTKHLRRIVKEWGECGKIVYVEGKALAYAQYAPPEYWPGARASSPNPISDDAVYLTCLCVLPYARGKGLGRVLLQSIEASLVKRRIKAIETLAVRNNEHPPGPIEFYLQNGFYIAKEDPRYPLLRLELKALVGWQINIQFALDGLKIPAGRRASAPVV
jgi:ribosomal protein S18 acetylase RimI-like enzyme